MQVQDWEDPCPVEKSLSSKSLMVMQQDTGPCHEISARRVVIEVRQVQCALHIVSIEG